jgi:hypothetical protein
MRIPFACQQLANLTQGKADDFQPLNVPQALERFVPIVRVLIPRASTCRRKKV